MAERADDIQLKFGGVSVERLDGAPADAVIASLNALQRMVYIIGMRSEGRSISERLKPPAKVKREYAVICRTPIPGSHIQPFNIASQSGAFTPAVAAARNKLLKTLKAFDSGDERRVEQALPNARERWFMAQAALGLIPPEDTGLEITVREGSRGPFAFRADRARGLLRRYEAGSPPEIDQETIVGKLRAIDFAQTILTIKPSKEPALRLDYPLPLERWLTANVRRRIKLVGHPKFNQKGDVSSFKELHTATELEPTLEPIEQFRADEHLIGTVRPLSIPVTVDWQDRIFLVQEKSLGIDVFSQSYDELRQCVMAELNVLWRHYALASDDELDSEALAVKHALLSRFKVVRP
ncbi:hypothetical protein [Methylocystis rosea]|uniref:hypothetical protein n=1 Tax=Methylocystis rosea TaxID=173366 RepID=UPI000365D7FC|nr:hypothetical protein [Methylocystis rosea]